VKGGRRKEGEMRKEEKERRRTRKEGAGGKKGSTKRAQPSDGRDAGDVWDEGEDALVLLVVEYHEALPPKHSDHVVSLSPGKNKKFIKNSSAPFWE
jgi:hypothetical protein